jgi:hypothetical protein
MARPDVARFLSSFVLPLVAGGEVHVGRPLTTADLQRFEAELGGGWPACAPPCPYRHRTDHQ